MHNKTSEGDTFSILVERLLAGEVICQITSEPLYKYLGDTVHKNDVDTFLRRISRMLRVTQDGTGYFAAYRDVSSPSTRAQIKQQFNEAINNLEPMVRWLKVASSAERSGTSLQVGDTLRGSELLEAIENAPALIDELDQLSRSKLFSNSSTGAKKQLDSILKRLCENGYLVPKGASGSVFVATGKWSRLYELLQFIAAHEQLDDDEGVPEQEDLLH